MIITVENKEYKVNKETAQLIANLLLSEELESMFFREQNEKDGNVIVADVWNKNKERVREDRERILKEIEHENKNGINEIDRQH